MIFRVDFILNVDDFASTSFHLEANRLNFKLKFKIRLLKEKRVRRRGGRGERKREREAEIISVRKVWEFDSNLTGVQLITH